jgi:uncharacterized LabA/DUF88 family protein
MWLNKPGEVTALLIDGANAYETQRVLGYQIDWQKIIKFFKPQQAMYFTALPEKDINKPNNLFKMIDHISYNSYVVVSKPVKFFNNDGVTTMKGNMDVEIAVHILKAARWANHIVLFTGDGDFRMAVEDVQSQGVKVTVVSSCLTRPSMVADELRRQSNEFIDLMDPDYKSKFYWDRPDRAQRFLDGGGS